jgi:hypothetical protein
MAFVEYKEIYLINFRYTLSHERDKNTNARVDYQLLELQDVA